jgi:hypothetical protein
MKILKEAGILFIGGILFIIIGCIGYGAFLFLMFGLPAILISGNYIHLIYWFGVLFVVCFGFVISYKFFPGTV